jgi:hypothetical protein
MCGAPERLPAFGALTFATVITTSVVQDLNEKIAGVVALIICCVARIVAAPKICMFISFLKNGLKHAELKFLKRFNKT